MRICARSHRFALFNIAAFAVAVCVISSTDIDAAEKAELPAVGKEASDFELAALGGKKVKLSAAVKEGPVVLVVLRGYPGYQCPVCSRQVSQFVGKAGEFKAAGAQVLLVYPGPAKELQQRADEFLKDRKLPDGFRMLLDPDYEFTNAYNLRWNAVRETAYPSTFVIDANRMIRYAKISMSHGDRAPVDAVLKALAAAKQSEKGS
jgi:thioredoxin-dependent peroxiredoxin